MNTLNILTLLGLALGLICGALIGRNSIYSSMYKANMIGNDELDNPNNQLDDQSRRMCLFVGGLFLILGILILIGSLISRANHVYPMADRAAYDIYEESEINRMLAEEEANYQQENKMLIVFSFICAGMGGLVLTPVITEKRRT